MHYADGTPAQVGDFVVNKPKYPGTGPTEFYGILTGASESSTTCNGNLQIVAARLSNGQVIPYRASSWCATIGECMKVPGFDSLLPIQVPPPIPQAPPSA